MEFLSDRERASAPINSSSTLYIMELTSPSFWKCRWMSLRASSWICMKLQNICKLNGLSQTFESGRYHEEDR